MYFKYYEDYKFIPYHYEDTIILDEAGRKNENLKHITQILHGRVILAKNFFLMII